MSQEEEARRAIRTLQAFIDHHGRTKECDIVNPDDSPCHACTRQIRETAEAQRALNLLEELTT
jgi:hypothetical protein